MKYSIIVPIYNAEKYISRCIDSIINQTFSDFELLLIDDGSKDKSFSICKDYEKKDNRIKVFKKENGGVSSARNLGIENAQGDYLLFFDSDDFVELNTLEVVNGYDADLIVFNANACKEERINKDTLAYDYFCGKLMKTLSFSTWNKVFSKIIIKENSIRFDKEIKIGEDMLFTYDYLLHIDTIQTIDSNLYYYEIRDDSAMNNSKKDYLGQYLITMEALKSRIRENDFVLSSWAVDVSAIIFVRRFFSEMYYKDFKYYMANFEKTNIRKYAVKNKDKKSLSKNTMIFFIKHKLYWLFQLSIKIRVK